MSIGGGNMKEKIAMAWIIGLVLIIIGFLIYKAMMSGYFLIILIKFTIVAVITLMTLWAIHTISLE
jgi:hypothetical protein